MKRKKQNFSPVCLYYFLSAAIRDVLQAFEKPENKSRMHEIRQEAGSDLVKLLQYQLPFAALTQEKVIKRHGFSDDGEGIIK